MVNVRRRVHSGLCCRLCAEPQEGFNGFKHVIHKALRDITEGHGCSYSSAPVGEVNVVAEMKRTGAVIGGEGNGGVIYPALHYGRDALAGIALFLTHLAKSKVTCSGLRRQYPDYYIAKKRVETAGDTDMTKLCTFS